LTGVILKPEMRERKRKQSQKKRTVAGSCISSKRGSDVSRRARVRNVYTMHSFLTWVYWHRENLVGELLCWTVLPAFVCVYVGVCRLFQALLCYVLVYKNNPHSLSTKITRQNKLVRGRSLLAPSWQQPQAQQLPGAGYCGSASFRCWSSSGGLHLDLVDLSGSFQCTPKMASPIRRC